MIRGLKTEIPIITNETRSSRTRKQNSGELGKNRPKREGTGEFQREPFVYMARRTSYCKWSSTCWPCINTMYKRCLSQIQDNDRSLCFSKNRWLGLSWITC